MGEGYGCSNYWCSTLATAIKFIHSCRRAAIVSKVAFFTYQIRSLFVHQIKDDTLIFNRTGHKGERDTTVGSPCWLYM